MFPMTLTWSKKQKIEKKENKKKEITSIDFYTKDVKQTSVKLLHFLYKTLTLRKKCIIDSNDINYDAFSTILTAEEPVIVYVYSVSH